MEGILHHLLSLKPYEKWDLLYINWLAGFLPSTIWEDQEIFYHSFWNLLQSRSATVGSPNNKQKTIWNTWGASQKADGASLFLGFGIRLRREELQSLKTYPPPLKTNIFPEKWWLVQMIHFLLKWCPFWGHVNSRGGGGVNCLKETNDNFVWRHSRDAKKPLFSVNLEWR